MLRARGTNQQWEIAGEIPDAEGAEPIELGEPVVLEGLLEEWQGTHLQLEPIALRRAP